MRSKSSESKQCTSTSGNCLLDVLRYRECAGYGDSQHLHRLRTYDSRDQGGWWNCTSTSWSWEDNFDGLGIVQSEVIPRCPLADVGNLLHSCFFHRWWDDEVGVVCEFHQLVLLMLRSQISSVDNIRCRANSWALDDASQNFQEFWPFFIKHYSMFAMLKEIHHPVVHPVGKLKL